MLRHNLEEFKRKAREIAADVPETWKRGAVEIGTASYAALVQKTEDTGSVDTGAYRAEHTIEQGAGYIFEHPGRVGPDKRLPSQKRIGAPPLIPGASLGAVRADLEARLRPGPFRFVNRRFVADWLENGTRNIAPRQIYATARDATENVAERVAARMSQQRIE